VLKSQTGHGHPMSGIGQTTCFMPGLPGRHNVHAVQLQLSQSRLDHCHMSRVWRVKRSTENTQTLDARLAGSGVLGESQTQALGTKK
jgi:hypothetical protein